MARRATAEQLIPEAKKMAHWWSPEFREAMRLHLVSDDRRERDLIHTLELREDGWSLQHPIRCRPNLLDCPVQQYCASHNVELEAMCEREGPGRWPETYLHPTYNDTLIVGEKE